MPDKYVTREEYDDLLRRIERIEEQIGIKDIIPTKVGYSSTSDHLVKPSKIVEQQQTTTEQKPQQIEKQTKSTTKYTPAQRDKLLGVIQSTREYLDKLDPASKEFSYKPLLGVFTSLRDALTNFGMLISVSRPIKDQISELSKMEREATKFTDEAKNKLMQLVGKIENAYLKKY